METGNKTDPHASYPPPYTVADNAGAGEAPESFRLTIELSSSFLNFALFHIPGRTFSRLEEKRFPLFNDNTWSSCWEECGLETNALAAITVVLHEPRYTLIPQSLFSEEESYRMLQVNHEINEPVKMHSIPCSTADMQVSFAANRTQLDWIRRNFSGAQVTHPVVILIESLLSNYKNQGAGQVFLHVRPGYADIIATQGQKLLLANTYAANTPEDTLYYMLFTMEQLDLNPDKTEVGIMGHISEDGPLHTLLKQYIRNLHFETRPLTVNYSEGYRHIPPHFFYILHHEYLCG